MDRISTRRRYAQSKASVAFCFSLFLGLQLPGLGAVENSPIVPHPDGSVFKISFVGDSITYGALVDPTVDCFPIVVGRLLGPKFKTGNFGAVAQTLQKGTGASYWDTQAFKDASNFAPDAVVIMLGTNDSKGGDVTDGKWAGEDKFRADYQALIDHFQQLPSKPRVWLCLNVPAYGDSAYGIRGSVIQNQIVPIVADIAAKAGVPTIDLNTPMQGHPEFFPDDVHPNKEGHLRMAQVVYSYLTGQPLVVPVGSNFSEPIKVTLTPTVKGTPIVYTVEGSEPTDNSPVYSEAIPLTASTTLKAATQSSSNPSGFTSSTSTFTKLDVLPATSAESATQGLNYSLFKSGNLDDPTGTPDETGEAAGLGKLPHSKDKGCAFVITGFVNVPKDGVYTFNMASYDTSVLFIDDKKIIDDGGSKGLYVAVTGQVALASGAHPVRFIYSQATGNPGLSLRYAGPGISITGFPDSGFTHVPPAK